MKNPNLQKYLDRHIFQGKNIEFFTEDENVEVITEYENVEVFTEDEMKNKLKANRKKIMFP